MNRPKVSILCITYNQKQYIRQCLDSLLSQNTDFNYEVLVNDDASTDGTSDILKDYQKRYPNQIILNLQSENQYSKGIRNMMVRFLLPKARGKYLAICEGDDFWTDPNKLQKQVDFMEEHPDYVICFHPVRIFFENKERTESIFPPSSTKTGFTVERLIMGNFIQTNSVMYRKQADYKSMDLRAAPGDWYLHLYHAQFGKIGFIKKVMSAYRRHSGGIWWESQKNIDRIWAKHGLEHARLYTEMLKMFGLNKKYRQIIERHIYQLYQNMIRIDKENGTKLISLSIAELPLATKIFICQHYKAIRTMNSITTRLRGELSVAKEVMKQKEKEINDIKSSKTWSTLARLRSAKATIYKVLRRENSNEK